MTAYAVREGVDLVLGAGGDGTIRVICSGLADTGIPFGLIPAGTGNLLAKNIGIPLDAALALDVALDGEDKPIDLVGADDRRPDPPPLRGDGGHRDRRRDHGGHERRPQEGGRARRRTSSRRRRTPTTRRCSPGSRSTTASPSSGWPT